jgi:hypothetical protein
VNWLLDDQLAKEHLAAIHRAAGGGRPRWEREPRRPGRVRRAIGTRFVSAGLGIAAGLRAAKSASDVVCTARERFTEEPV